MIISKNLLKAYGITLFISSVMPSCNNKTEESLEQPQRPNILFIMSDDHTSQGWGIYGGPLKDYVKADNIKRLAKEGCTLDNCLVANSISAPSRACILTGQYNHLNGVPTLGDTLDPKKLNIAKVLKKSGYQTAIMGKWHLKTRPSGFDDFCIFWDQGVYWDPKMKTPQNWAPGPNVGEVHKGFSTDIVSQLTMDWLDKRDKSKPFFMMCHFKATHEPWDYPERFADLYKNDTIPEPESLYDFGPETTGRTIKGQSLDNLEKRWVTASNGPWWCDYPGLPYENKGLTKKQARSQAYQKLVKDFMRCGAAVDDNIGKLLDYLDRNGLAENTIVVYTADQGYFLGEHGFFDKRLIYEESLHMPFVIRYPKEIPAGTRLEDIIQNVDFPALFADYAGVQKPKSFQGQSFRQNLEGKTPKDWRKTAYYRYWEHSPDRPAHFGVRDERYTLAFFYGHPLGFKADDPHPTTPTWEFYDRQKDPKQLHNAYNDPEYKDIIKKMKQEILRQRKLVKDEDENQYPVLKELMDKYWD